MATAAEEISSRLASIAGINIERDLIHTPQLGSAGDFSGWRDMFERITEFALLLSGCSWQKLPTQMQRDIHGQSLTLFLAIEAIRDFPASDRSSTERDGRVNNLQNAFDSFRLIVIPYVGYLLLDNIHLDEYRQSLERTIAEGSESLDRLSSEYGQRTELLIADASQSINQLSSEIQGAKSEAERALSEIRAVAAEAGVSQEAGTFHEAANRYESLAKRWLWGSVGSALVTIGVGLAVVFVWNTGGEGSATALVQAVLGRAAVLAVLSFATLTAVRMYRSNSHLAVVNRHREDALKSFNAFREGTHSDDTKDKILLAAAHAAFGQTATGLISEKADGGNTLEVFEGLFGRSVRGS